MATCHCLFARRIVSMPHNPSCPECAKLNCLQGLHHQRYPSVMHESEHVGCKLYVPSKVTRNTYFCRLQPIDDDVEGTTLSAIECCVGILSACLPTYRPLWRKYGYARTKSPDVAIKAQPNELSIFNRTNWANPVGKGTPRTMADGGCKWSNTTD